MKYVLKIVLIGQLTVGAWVGACSPISPPPSALQAYYTLKKLKIGDMTCPESFSGLKLNSCVSYGTTPKNVAHLYSHYLRHPYKKSGSEWIIEKNLKDGIFTHVLQTNGVVLVGEEDKTTSYEILESLVSHTGLKVYASCTSAGIYSQKFFTLENCRVAKQKKGYLSYSGFSFSVLSSSDGTISPGHYYYEPLVQLGTCPDSLLRKVGDL